MRNINNIKNIAVFHCTSEVGSAWGCAEGISQTLSRMGYTVLDCARPENQKITYEDLSMVDLIILSAPEWYYQNLIQLFGSRWAKLKARKVAWFAESAHRDDREFPMAEVLKLVDVGYFPAIQDAEEFNGKFLPFGADIQIFRPMSIKKEFDAAFLGSMYPKRIDYVKGINYPITHIHSLSDADPIKSFQMLAQAYNSTKIFVNLPALSRLIVTKVTEVMACKTMVITPFLDHISALQNMSQFENGRHLVYYDPTKPEILGDVIKYYLHNPAEIDRIANNGYEYVIENFSLEKMLETIISESEESASNLLVTSSCKDKPERIDFHECPLCESTKLIRHKIGNCSNHPLYYKDLNQEILWMQCNECEHIFTSGYYSEWACNIIFNKINSSQKAGYKIEDNRVISSRMVENVLPFCSSGRWLDVGFGNGSLLFTAMEYGFTPIGIDLRHENVEILKSYGIDAYATPLNELQLENLCAVISLADVLEHVPFPKPFLRHAYSLLEKDGLLLISMPNTESMSWKMLDKENSNPYWGELEHYHNFSKTRLYLLLVEAGFSPIKYRVSERYRACMEIVARKIV
jgi:SAM-dependent methyltransferase